MRRGSVHGTLINILLTLNLRRLGNVGSTTDRKKPCPGCYLFVWAAELSDFDWSNERFIVRESGDRIGGFGLLRGLQEHLGDNGGFK